IVGGDAVGTLLRSGRFRPILHPGPESSKAQSTGRRYLTTIRARLRSHNPLPMPSTLRSSSGFLNGPCVSRYSTIFSATRRPTPSSFISSLTSAVLMLTEAAAGTDVVSPGCDGGAARAGHDASHPNATSKATIAGRTRHMEFLLRSGARHSLERSRAKPLNPPSAERVNVQSFGHARTIPVSRSRIREAV